MLPQIESRWARTGIDAEGLREAVAEFDEANPAPSWPPFSMRWAYIAFGRATLLGGGLMSEQRREAASDIQDTASRFLKALQPYAPAILSGLEVITKATQAFSDFVAREIAPHLATLARIDWAEVTRRLNELPAKSKAAMVLASSKGWFFGWDQSLEDVLVLVEKIAQIDLSEVDELLSQYYRDNLQSMAHSLASQYPDRAAAINAAVKAHAELGSEGYYLSVPVSSPRQMAC